MDLGENGPVQWIVSEGSPRTGRANPELVIPTDIAVPQGSEVVQFREEDLRAIHQGFLDQVREGVREEYLAEHSASDPTSSRTLRNIEHQAWGKAEGLRWTEVGERVARSESGVGRVVLGAGSVFSPNRPGGFMLTSHPELITVRGGPQALLDVIRQAGLPAEPAVVEAAESLARRGEIRGRVEGAFRVGGRVLVIAGAAADGWRIYTADDRLRETAEVVGGWGGAAAGVAGYNVAVGWTNAGDPIPWGINLLGNIGAGFIGYWGGEAATSAVCDLVVDGDPIEVPAE